MPASFNLEKADRLALYDYAVNTLNLQNISVKDTPETLRIQIRQALGDVEAVRVATPQKSKNMVKINIARHPTDKQPVQVGVNGYLYLIQRGHDVEVPEQVVEVLRNANSDVYDPETMEAQEVLAYPFTIVN